MDTDINQKFILAHIVGINDHNKLELINLIKYSKVLSNILIIDVDIITQKILEEKNMIILLNKNEFNKDKNNFKNLEEFKVSLNKSKDIEKKIFQYWKVKMEYYINKLSKNNNKIILIGYLSFFNNHKIYINLDITPKFFVKVNYNDHAKMIIKYNIENSKQDIIDGKFDLNYLDSNFLIKKRIQIQSIYLKISYILMPLNNIINTIELCNQDILPKSLYYSSFNKYDKKIPIISNNIIAYSNEWLAITSILYNNDTSFSIKKGIKNNKEYIILSKDQYNKMLNGGYIYEIDSTSDFIPFPSKNNIYKFLTTKPIKVCKFIYIDNIINQLKKLNIDINIIN